MREIILKLIKLDKTTLFMATLIIIFSSVFIILFLEPETFTTFHEGLWWVMTTVTTVGYGDYAPVTRAGRYFAMVLYLIGIGVLGVVISLLANAMGVLKKKKEEGKLKYRGKDHVVIIGWSKKAKLAIDEILLADKKTEVVLIDELNKEPLDNNRVHYIQGDATNKETMKQANIEAAKNAIIFATDCSSNSRLVDGNSLILASAIEKIAPQVYTTVEVLEKKHVPMFEYVDIDEIVLSDEFVSRMLVRSSFQNGVSNVFNQLLSRRIGDDLREIERKPHWKTYRDAVDEITSKGATLISVGEKMDIYKRLDEPLPAGKRLRIICNTSTYEKLASV